MLLRGILIVLSNLRSSIIFGFLLSYLLTQLPFAVGLVFLDCVVKWLPRVLVLHLELEADPLVFVAFYLILRPFFIQQSDGAEHQRDWHSQYLPLLKAVRIIFHLL